VRYRIHKYKFTTEPILWIGCIVAIIQGSVSALQGHATVDMQAFNTILLVTSTVISRLLVIPKFSTVSPGDVVDAIDALSAPKILGSKHGG
jgi:hypothetical protein